ncbi:unnamed protein product [Scytosiphon promiscuus]
MLRSIFNENERFKSTTDAKAKDVNALLVLRRELIGNAWKALDEGWDALQESVRGAGIVSQSAAHERGLLSLNLGGSIIGMSRSVLVEVGRAESPAMHLANLVSTDWDTRVPRDADGHIVVDESSTCSKHLIYNLIRQSGTATGMAGPSFGDELPSDEKAYMPHVCRVLGLTDSSPCPGIYNGMAVTGGSTVLKPDELGPLTATLREWCPGDPTTMKLLYRGSRDGWTGQDFQAHCGDSSAPTITLFRVSNGGATTTTESVVGGFSSVSWGSAGQHAPQYAAYGYGYPPRFGTSSSVYRSSPGAFVFMLMGGTMDCKSTTSFPTKWGIRQGSEQYAVRCGPGEAAHFGEWTLSTTLSVGMNVICTSSNIYDIPPASPFIMLNGRPVVEIEVFQIHGTGTAAQPRPPVVVEKPKPAIVKAGLIDLPAQDANAMSAESHSRDSRSFGVSIADSLMEERVALHQAHVELAQANAKAAASVSALVAFYGQDVAANKKDAAVVVELNVRGTRMTTLLSTLQACPNSAFAARFDHNKWPPAGKDVDEHGRHVISDCSPSVFSKILDVLRIRKRAGWASDEEKTTNRVLVVVKAADRKEFEDFVHIYFTGHESFVMDLVQNPY